MKTIPITQFLRPNGEKRALVCDVSDDVANLGYRPLAVSGTTGPLFALQEMSEA